jgi:hypothetical protein
MLKRHSIKTHFFLMCQFCFGQKKSETKYFEFNFVFFLKKFLRKLIKSQFKLNKDLTSMRLSILNLILFFFKKNILRKIIMSQFRLNKDLTSMRLSISNLIFFFFFLIIFEGK